MYGRGGDGGGVTEGGERGLLEGEETSNGGCWLEGTFADVEPGCCEKRFPGDEGFKAVKCNGKYTVGGDGAPFESGDTGFVDAASFTLGCSTGDLDVAGIGRTNEGALGDCLPVVGNFTADRGGLDGVEPTETTDVSGLTFITSFMAARYKQKFRSNCMMML